MSEAFRLSDIIRVILYFFVFINQSSIIALIAYDSKVIANHLEYLAKDITVFNLPQVLQKVCIIKEHVKKFDNLLSFQIFLMILTCTTLEINLICIISVDFLKSYTLLIIVIIDCFILLISLCFVCDILPKSLDKFYDSVEKNITQSNLPNESSVNYILLLKSMKDQIGYTACGFVKIRASTILSILALIISYSVILIQTS